MAYHAEVICDSINFPYSDWENEPGERSRIRSKVGVRLTTMQVTMPRIVLSEFNTHRVFSRNSASSRAIPVDKRIALLESDPFIPDSFMANKKGMQAGEALDYIAQQHAQDIWLRASKDAIVHAKELAKLGVHKQWANRLLEPFTWQTVICTATEWENFFNLRRHPDAQPEIRKVAELMFEAMNKSKPNVLNAGDWHIPYVEEEDIAEAHEKRSNDPTFAVNAWLIKLSVARCARVSYLTHDTGKRDIEADISLHNRLYQSGHMSPFEHCAQVLEDESEYFAAWENNSNFAYPWKQYRKFLKDEAVFRGER